MELEKIFEYVELNKKRRNSLIMGVVLLILIYSFYTVATWRQFFETSVINLAIVVGVYVGLREGIYNTYENRIKRENKKKTNSFCAKSKK